MAFIHMECPNCGAGMKLVNNQFVCGSCRTTAFNIVDAKIDEDVTVMTPEEFEARIEKNKRQFLVKIDDNLKVFDVNTMVINKKIQDATAEHTAGRFDFAINILDGISNEILSVERLRFLCEFKVKNEQELTTYDGYIDNSEHYKKILQLANAQTRETYLKLGEYCRERYDTKQRIEQEIEEVKKLLEVKLYQEAIAYTKEMCKRYPQTALSWAYAYEVKCTISENYNGDIEFSMMQKCPDYSQMKMPERLSRKIADFKKLSKAYALNVHETTNAVKRIAGFLWLLVVSLGLILGGSIFEMNDLAVVFLIIGNIGIIGGEISFVALIINIVMAIRRRNDEKDVEKIYKQQYNRIPKAIQKEAAVEIKENRAIYYRLIISALLTFISMIVGFCILCANINL